MRVATPLVSVYLFILFYHLSLVYSGITSYRVNSTHSLTYSVLYTHRLMSLLA